MYKYNIIEIIDENLSMLKIRGKLNCSHIFNFEKTMGSGRSRGEGETGNSRYDKKPGQRRVPTLLEL